MESSIQSQYFLESYKDTTITISGTENTTGHLEIDENGNYVNSGLIGTQVVFKCSQYSGFNPNTYVLFHDAENNILGMIGGTFDKENKDYSGLKNDFVIDDTALIYYKINTVQEYKTFSGNSVTFDTLNTTTNAIFKVYLNGTETTDYTTATDTLTFSSGINLFGNNVVIYYYPLTQSLGGKSIIMHYYSPYKHEVTDNTSLIIGYDVSATGTVSSDSNIITTSIDLSSVIFEYDDIRLGDEVRQVLYVDATTIKTDKVFTTSHSAEDIYLLPYKMMVNIENESESLGNTFYEFTTKGIKLPIKIKTAISNNFNFDYKIDREMIVSECNIANYISDNLSKYMNEINKMRLIRSYYKDTDDIDKFIYLTNIRKIESFNYNKGLPDTYNASLEFEDKLTLDMNVDYETGGILGEGGVGNYRLIRE